MDEQRKTQGGVWIPIAGWWWWCWWGDALHWPADRADPRRHPECVWNSAFSNSQSAANCSSTSGGDGSTRRKEIRLRVFGATRVVDCIQECKNSGLCITLLSDFRTQISLLCTCVGILKMLTYQNVDPNITKLLCIQIRSQNAFHISHPIAQNNLITHHNLIAFGISYPRQAPKVSATRQHCHISRWNTRKVLTASGGRGRREKLIRH